MQPATAPADEQGRSLLEYWDIIVDNRWLVAGVTLLVALLGGTYALIATPVYETNLLVQVEDATASKSLLGAAGDAFENKTPAAGEIEIMRSRMIVGPTVENTLYDIHAAPRYVPVIGKWLARRATELSEPGFLGFPGYVTGTEKIVIGSFSVPRSMEGTPFRLIAKPGNGYVLSHAALEQEVAGTVGVPVSHQTPLGLVQLTVNELRAKPGAEFSVMRRSRLAAIRSLQGSLRMAEKGRNTGLIDVAIQGGDPGQLVRVLNEIGRQYVRQNIERKAAEAQKTIAFLDVQMPQLKKQLDSAEEAYNRYRNVQGTVALDEEAKLILNQSVDLQGKLVEAQQKRLELASRFTSEHPTVKTLDGQIGAWQNELRKLNSRVRALPSVQQEALRLERDVKVNNELYQSLRNNAMQLQLVREGKIGNVRVIDEAVPPLGPVRPQRGMIMTVAVMLGFFAGVILALARSLLFKSVRDPQEIEAATGLNVFSTIPISPAQEEMARKVEQSAPGVHVLAEAFPADPAIESLRSLRTAMQFAMLEAADNRILVTGATPGVGKSFISVNFAAIMASAGRRVLLIDADMRKGYLNHYFGLHRAGGLSEAIAGSRPVSEVIRRSVLPNLDLLTTGVMPPNPAELMQSAALANLLETLSAQYDLVIMDTPPVLVAADTASAAPHLGTVLLVARAGVTHMGELHESAKRLAHAGRTVSGVLFNAMDFSRRYYGAYGYKYGYYRYRQYSYQQPTN